MKLKTKTKNQFDLKYLDAGFKSERKVRTSIKDDSAENIKAAQKKKNVIMIVDIRLKQKLGSIIWC